MENYEDSVCMHGVILSLSDAPDAYHVLVGYMVEGNRTMQVMRVEHKAHLTITPR